MLRTLARWIDRPIGDAIDAAYQAGIIAGARHMHDELTDTQPLRPSDLDDIYNETAAWAEHQALTGGTHATPQPGPRDRHRSGTEGR